MKRHSSSLDYNLVYEYIIYEYFIGFQISIKASFDFEVFDNTKVFDH